MISYQFENDGELTIMKEFTWVNTELIKNEIEEIIKKNNDNKFTWESIDNLYTEYLSKIIVSKNKCSFLTEIYYLNKTNNKNYLLFIFFKTLLDEFDDIYDYLYLHIYR
jgi:hypothetical protein